MKNKRKYNKTNNQGKHQSTETAQEITEMINLADKDIQ